MGTDFLPKFINENYEVVEWHHATAILERDFPNEWNDLIEVLTNFKLLKSHIIAPGGRKSPVANALDGEFYKRGWKEVQFDTKVVVDGNERSTPTHNVDCYKNKIGVEIEWNNKDPFYDRDLNNFRLLHELRVISVGVHISFMAGHNPFCVGGIIPKNAPKCGGCRKTPVDENDHVALLTPRKRWIFLGSCERG